MFTGIVEERGAVVAPGARLVVRARTVGSDAVEGDSIAVSGVCLTVVGREPEPDGEVLLSFDLAPETLARTTLGGLEPGDPVNLERPATLLSRMGGHLVQGHVDGVGTVVEAWDVATGREIAVDLPPGLERYVVEKGSIAVDGVSLTVTTVQDGRFGVALIPHTLAATSLGARRPGDRVNLEVDVIAKYVERLVEAVR